MFRCCQPKKVADQFEELVGPDPQYEPEEYELPETREEPIPPHVEIPYQQINEEIDEQIEEESEETRKVQIDVESIPSPSTTTSPTAVATPTTPLTTTTPTTPLTTTTPTTTTTASPPPVRKVPLVQVSKVANAKGSPTPGSGAATVRDAQQKLLEANKPKTPHRPKAAAKKGWQPQNFSADVNGLRTKNRDKMVDLVDDKFKKNLIRAINFVREISDKDSRDSADVPAREKAFLLYLFLQSVSHEIEGKQQTVATIVSQVAANSEGEKALATTKVKSAAKRLQFMAKAYYKPVLDQLYSPNQKQTIAQVVDDFHTTANVLFGDKPPTLRERTNPFIVEILTAWNWDKCKQWGTDNPAEFQKSLDSLLDAFETCRKGGNTYESVVTKIAVKVSK